MNSKPPAKKSPALALTNTAIEQAKTHQITKAMALDVMKNRAGVRKLDNGQVQFTGSASYPNTYITAQFSEQRQQWVITDIQIQKASPPPAKRAQAVPKPPAPVAKTDQRDKNLPVVAFTNHAREVLEQDALDKRIVEHIIHHPDEKQDEDEGKVRFIGEAKGQMLHVIATYLKRERKWLVITVQLHDKSYVPAKPKVETSSVTFTHHAEEVLEREFIDQRFVEQVVLNPTEKHDEDEGKVRFIGEMHGRMLHVIGKYLPDERKWLVITVQLHDKPQAPVKASKPAAKPKVETSSITFTHHADEVMERERIDKRFVEQVILNPSEKQDADEGTVRFIGKMHGRMLHVIGKYLPDERKWLVITVQLRDKSKSSPAKSKARGKPKAKPKAREKQNKSGSQAKKGGPPQIAYTRHARERMRLRKIYEEDVELTIADPQSTEDDEEGKVKFIGKELSHDRAIHVVGRFNADENKWVIVSVWVRGEDDDGKLSTWKPKHARRSSKQTEQAAGNTNLGTYIFLLLLVAVAAGIAIFVMMQLGML